MAEFQYSHLTRLEQSISEAWSTDTDLLYWTMLDSLGNRSRIAQICLSGGKISWYKENQYFIFQRVRVQEAYGAIAFLGRIIAIEPNFENNHLILTCRDYLGELADKVVTAESGDGKYSAASRNGLLSKIIKEESEEPDAGQDIDRSILPRMLQDTGNYLEKITKTYSMRGMYDLDPESRVASSYDYRGTTTVLEAISEIAEEDSQQDLQVLYYTDQPTDPSSTSYINDKKKFPSTYWADHTGGLADGTEWFYTPRGVITEATFPAALGTTKMNDIVYFGSNSKFDGLEYTFRQSGSLIHESNYSDLEWQYWNGDSWVKFVPDYDTKFKADARDVERVMGRTYWSSLLDDTTNTHTSLGTNTSASTALDGAINSTVTSITVDSSTNLYVGSLITIGSEVMKIINISGDVLTVSRAYNDTTAASHNDNVVVLGGKKQGMADWSKRDLEQTVDMHSFNDWNDNDNSKWKSWKNPWQSNNQFNYFRVPVGSGQLTTFDARYPAGTPIAHRLRDGDTVTGSNFTGFEATYTGAVINDGNGSHTFTVPDRTNNILVVTALCMAREPVPPAAGAFHSGSGGNTPGTCTLTGPNHSGTQGELRGVSNYFWSGYTGNSTESGANIETYLFTGLGSGSHTLSITNPSGYGNTMGHTFQATLYSGINAGSIAFYKSSPSSQGGNIGVTSDQSVTFDTAAGDFLHMAGMWARPGANNSYDFVAPTIYGNFTQHRLTNLGLHVNDTDNGNVNGANYFVMGHHRSNQAGLTSTVTLDIDNSGGFYKGFVHAMRLPPITPGVGSGGFLNGDNYVDVLNPFVISLYSGYTGTNTIGGDSFSGAASNTDTLDVSERSGVSATETLLEVGGSVRPDDVTSESMPSLGIGDARGTYKYWIRCFVKRSDKYALLNDGSNINATDTSLVVDSYVTGTTAGTANALDFSAGDVVTMHTEDMLVTSVSNASTMIVTRGHNGTTAASHNNNLSVNGTVPAQIATLSLYTPPKVFRDFRAEDPKPFDEIWSYSSNIAATTLDEPLDNSETGVDVDDASGLAIDDVITVDSEDMHITAISSNTLTVTRGFNSGAELAGDKATHSDGARVTVSLFSENNHDVPGGSWYSLNRESGAFGSALLWDARGGLVRPLTDNTQMLYLGSDDPFNGFEMHALQGSIFRITSITSANPAVVTTSEPHGLTTNDWIVITGANSGIAVDGYRQVTVVSSTTFSVAVNNSGAAGNNGAVLTGIPDYSNVTAKFDILDTFPRNFWNSATDGRTNTKTAWRTIQPTANYTDISWSGRTSIGSLVNEYPLAALGPTRWRPNVASISQGSVHWTCEVRFNTDKPRNSITLKNTALTPDRVLPPLNPVRSFPVPEYDYAYAMSNDTAWSNRSPLIGPYSSHQRGTGAHATIGVGNADVTQLKASTTAYVGSTTDVAMTFTTAHKLAVGDYINLWGTQGAQVVDGTYRVKTVTSRYALTFDCGRTGLSFGSNEQMNVDRISRPPNTKSLYWMRMRISGVPIEPAFIRHIRTASNARFKYFDRGKEPWITNNSNSPIPSAANNNLDAVYAFHQDVINEEARIQVTASAALNGFTQITAASHGLAVGSTFEIRGCTDTDLLNGIWKVARVVDANNVVIVLPFVSTGVTGAYMYRTEFTDLTPIVSSNAPYGKTLDLEAVYTGQPGSIRTVEPHQFRINDALIFTNTGSSPPTGNVYIVNGVLDPKEFTCKVQDNTYVNVTSATASTGEVARHLSIIAAEAGSSCLITTRNTHNLIEGQTITITGTAGTTPSINTTTIVKEVLSSVEFTIPITTTGSDGTANTGYLSTPAAVPHGTTRSAVGDMIYFGSRTPFTQLRFDAISSTLSNGGGSLGVWEYFKGSHDGKSSDWTALDVTDLTGGFKGYLSHSDYEVSFFAPGFGFWKSCMAGQKDGTAAVTGQTVHLNQRFGEAYYFVRFRFTAAPTSGAVGSAISLRRIWCGPNIWSPELETDTISGQTNLRHTTNLSAFGLTLDDRETSHNESSVLRVVSYSLQDQTTDFVNVVTVRGRAGSFASVRDEESIKKFRIVKEKIVDDSTLINDTQCSQRAIAILNQVKSNIPIDILDISATNPAVVTTGGSYKYLAYTDNNNPMQVTLFEQKGIQIESNSAEATIRTSLLDGAINNSVTTVTVELVDAMGGGSGDFAVDQIILIGTEQMLITAATTAGNNILDTVFTVIRAWNGTTAASHADEAEVFIYNQTYMNTESAHNLVTGDKVLITDVENTAPRYRGVGSYNSSASVGNQSSYNFIHRVFVTGQKQFYIQTADADLSTLDYELSDRTITPATNGLSNAFDAVGAIVHPVARTALEVGDKIKLRGTVHTAVNDVLSTISKVNENRSVVELSGVSAGTTPTDSLGYAFISEPHGLSTGNSVYIRGTDSIPSINGYRFITRLSRTTFSVNTNLLGGKSGTDGILTPTSIKQAIVQLQDFPAYTAGNGMPKILRAGDMVNLYLGNAGIANEQWLVYSIIYGQGEGDTKLLLFKSLSSVAETGGRERQMLRNLSEHLRETANAVFQPVDKSVQNSLDFIPEGPSRPTVRMNMDATALKNSVDVPNAGLLAGDHTQSFPDDFRLSWQMYENFPTRETVNKDLLRVDMQGLRSDNSGDSTGGAGLTFIARDATDGVSGATPDFHPDDGEATLYLRKSDTASEGTGLYLAHRGVFNSGSTYDEWDTDTPKLQAEVFVGLSGRKQADSSGNLVVVLPALTSIPRIMANTESNGYVQITNSTTSATLTARDAAGSAINGAWINYVVLFNSTKNTTGLNAHF